MFGYHVILSALAGLISGYCIFDLASIMAIALWMYVFVIGIPVICPHYEKLADALQEDIRSLEKRIEKTKEIHVALDNQRDQLLYEGGQEYWHVIEDLANVGCT